MQRNQDEMRRARLALRRQESGPRYPKAQAAAGAAMPAVLAAQPPVTLAAAALPPSPTDRASSGDAAAKQRL